MTNSAATTTTTTFRPRARLLSLLGEQLISDQAVGLIELVKNAYDADATGVEVALTGLSDLATTRIVLRDNGFGMTRDDIEQKWLSPAVNHKERQKQQKQRTPRGRLPIGEKGVGRFAVHQLGRHFQLVSRSANAPEVVFQVNWDDFDRGDVYLDTVPVTLLERPPEVFLGDATGTLLVIEAARTLWSETLVAKVQKALRRLQSPHQTATDFTIKLRCPDFPAYEQIQSSDLLERAHYIFRGRVDERGWLDYVYHCVHPAVPARHVANDNFNLVPSASKEITMTESQTFTIHLSFVNADDRQPDPATVGEEARQAVNDLREQGYTVQPAYTGAKGGDVFTIAVQIGQSIVDNKELLISLISVATPILTFLLNRHEKRLDKNDRSAVSQQQEQSIDIYISINQATVQVDTADLDDNEQLLRKLLEVQPDLIDTVTPETKPEIEVRVTRKQQRRRR